MAKELPYFRFYPSEWLEGDITLEKDKTQTFFIKLLCWYWKKDCNIDLEFIQKRLINNKATLKQCLNNLINSGIIKINENQSVSITFLDEQFDLLSDLRQKSVDAGRKGGQQKASNAKATLKQKASYKDKDNNKNKEKIYSDFDFFKNEFKEIWLNEFISLKKRKKASVSDRSLKSGMKKIKEYSKGNYQRALKILQKSVDSGWTDFYELKEENTTIYKEDKKIIRYPGVIKDNLPKGMNKISDILKK